MSFIRFQTTDVREEKAFIKKLIRDLDRVYMKFKGVEDIPEPQATSAYFFERILSGSEVKVSVRPFCESEFDRPKKGERPKLKAV